MDFPIRTMVAVVAAGIFFFLAGCSGQTDQSSEFRVMSYNIAAGYGDLAGIAEVILEQKPDLIGLQEVDVHWSERSDFVDQATWLAEVLEMEVFFGEIYNLPPVEATELPGTPENREEAIEFPEDAAAHPRRYGLAILSKYPVVKTQNHIISRLSTIDESAGPQPMPGFPEVVVEVGNQPIRFFNTHLDFRSDPKVRQMQVEEMLAIIGLEGPALLVGDLNARPPSQELVPLFSFFQDSWQGKEDPGYTFPSSDADRRIDYILHTEQFEVKTAFVVPTGASDHLPVVADLKLQNSP